MYKEWYRTSHLVSWAHRKGRTSRIPALLRPVHVRIRNQALVHEPGRVPEDISLAQIWLPGLSPFALYFPMTSCAPLV
jgi:hypothetical protein